MRLGIALPSTDGGRPLDAGTLAGHLAAHGVKAEEAKTRYGADGYGPSIYLTDPEGNTVELKGPPTTPKA